MNTFFKIFFSLFLILSNVAYAKIDTTFVNKKTKYSAEVVPENMSISQKKQRFRDLFVPAIDEVYAELEKQYKEVEKLIQKNPNSPEVQKLKKFYGASDMQDLLRRLKPHPKSITLSQAAMESAWGTSRLYRVAKNLFGVWSFNENEPRVPAAQKRGNKTIWLKKYANITDSIRDYYKLLATSSAFESFRHLKMKTTNPYKLVTKLDKYSEKGAKYGEELAAMIRYNRFNEFDSSNQ